MSYLDKARVIRSDYAKPVGITAVRWYPHSGMPVTALKKAGLQHQKQSGQWHPNWPGTDHLIVRPDEVFRAGIESHNTAEVDLQELQQRRQPGTLTLLVDDQEVSLAF